MRYVLYCKGRLPTDTYNRMLIPVFEDAGIARLFLDEFVGLAVSSREERVITLPDGFSVKSDQLDQILKANGSGVELPERMARWVYNFKHRAYWGEKAPCRSMPQVEGTPRTERERRPDRPIEYITITDLCTASGVLPMHARAALRASGLEKPAYGWSFDPGEIARIKEICGIT